LIGAVDVGLTRRQVFGLPEIMVRVSEYQAVARQCGCGTVTCGIAPDPRTHPGAPFADDTVTPKMAWQVRCGQQNSHASPELTLR
jgi:hypothetical protein